MKIAKQPELIADMDEMIIRLGSKTRYVLSWGMWARELRPATLIARTETLPQLKMVIAMLLARKQSQGWVSSGLGRYTVGVDHTAAGKMFSHTRVDHVARGIKPGIYRAGFWTLRPPASRDKWLLVPMELQFPVSHTADLTLQIMRPVSYWEMK